MTNDLQLRHISLDHVCQTRASARFVLGCLDIDLGMFSASGLQFQSRCAFLDLSRPLTILIVYYIDVVFNIMSVMKLAMILHD